MLKAVAGAAILSCLTPGRADACSFFVLPHEIDPSEQKVDTEPPQPVLAEVGRITRGRNSRGSSCDDIGVVEVNIVRAGDNRTPMARLGFRVTIVDGTIPWDFAGRAAAFRVVPDRQGRVRFPLPWVDGASDVQEPFDFTFVVTTVDLAGNESARSTPIRAAHPGSSEKPR